MVEVVLPQQVKPQLNGGERQVVLVIVNTILQKNLAGDFPAVQLLAPPGLLVDRPDHVVDGAALASWVPKVSVKLKKHGWRTSRGEKK